MLLWCEEEMCDGSDNRGRARRVSRVHREEVNGRNVSEADISFFFLWGKNRLWSADYIKTQVRCHNLDSE